MRVTAWPITLSWSIGFRRAGVVNSMALHLSFGDHQSERALGEWDLERIIFHRRSALECGGHNGVRALRQNCLRRLDPPWLRRNPAKRGTARTILLQDRCDRDD